MSPTVPGDPPDAPVHAARCHLRRAVLHYALRGAVGAVLVLVRLARRRRRRAARHDDLSVLLTGTFHSTNWLRAHVEPIAASGRCARVRVVAASPLNGLRGVDIVCPPRWMAALVGPVPARLLMFAWTAARTRPDVVGGFHLLVNGLAAGVVAPAVGARSLYFCVGGPTEIRGGGVFGENRLFRQMETPDLVVERRLLQVVRGMDLVVTMGTGARQFLRDRDVVGRIEVMPGGISSERVGLAAGRPSDVVFVGRLVSVKRLDLLLKAIHAVRKDVPGVTLAVVGDGPLRPALEDLAYDLGLADRVHFAGHQADVGPWLHASRVFALTSESEGVSLALLEAMACGLPAVVSDVGDLRDVVQNDVNGFLVRDRTAASFARCLVRLLRDAALWRQFSAAAARAAAPHRIDRAAERWNGVLGDLA